MSYCASRFETIRRRTVEVMIGQVGVGGTHPIRVQSMTTSDTQDVAATVKQSIALAEVGCEIVRVTAPNVAAARCLKDIRTQLTAAGFGHVPLVADIHFLPAAAMEAVEHVEKIRVNPGNYADKKKFAVREYSDSDYDREIERLHETFSPLVKRCQQLGRAMRIGTNHGSLSDRIMNRYGDTPLGMVESALEFLRIAESHDYRQIVLSMKASNPKVMIQAYRLLVQRMAEEAMHYPLHLGVTEAGDGEDGRIKSAIGIGSLLLDGLGDTIRVSLTEDSVYEIPVAQALARKAMARWTQPASAPAAMANGKSPMAKSRGVSDPSEAVATSPAATLCPPGAAESVAPATAGPNAPISTGGRTRSAPPSPSSGLGQSPPAIGQSSPSAISHLPSAICHLPLAIGPSASAPAEAVDPYHYARREVVSVSLGDTCAIGPEQPPRVLVRAPSAAALPEIATTLATPRLQDTPAEGMLVPIASAADLAALRANAKAWPVQFLALELDRGLTPADVTPLLIEAHAPLLLVREFQTGEGETLRAWANLVHQGGRHVLAVAAQPAALASLVPWLSEIDDERFLVTLAGAPETTTHAVGTYRQLAAILTAAGSRAPLWIRNTREVSFGGDVSFLSRLLDASILTGALLCDGLGDLVSVETEPDLLRAVKLSYNVLQGAGARISKTEFVACPSCGRTLFDLQTTTQRIRAKTGHLKGVKIAIMGCIVNGPGEMADADFGYVGGAPGKINLYVGKTCVQYNIPQAEADDRLIALIRAHDKWFDPKPDQQALAS